MNNVTVIHYRDWKQVILHIYIPRNFGISVQLHVSIKAHGVLLRKAARAGKPINTLYAQDFMVHVSPFFKRF